MPHLNTSTWPIIITSMLLTLHLIMQLKLLNTSYHLSPSQKIFNTQNYNSPWQSKWTKIYLLHSSPQQF